MFSYLRVNQLVNELAELADQLNSVFRYMLEQLLK